MTDIPLFKVFMPESVMEPLKATLMSGYVAQGPRVEEFEKALSARLQAPYPLTVNRNSTRLNSSHLGISYAVFCLKKIHHTPDRKSTRLNFNHLGISSPVFFLN